MPRLTRPRQGEPIRLVRTPNGAPRYQAVVTTSAPGARKRAQARRNFATLSEARAFVDRTRTNVREGAFTASDGTTLRDLAEQWLSTRRDVREVSRSGYAQVLKPVLSAHGDRRAQGLTRADVERWVESWRTEGGVRGRGWSHRSTVYALNALRLVLAHGVSSGVLSRNVAEGVRPPRKRADDHREVTVWTVPELSRFVAAADADPLAAALRLSAAGLRRSEVLGLDWSAVDLTTGTIEVRQGRVKAGKGRTSVDDPKSCASRRAVAVEALWPGTRGLLREEWVRQGQPTTGLVVVNSVGQPLDPDAFGKRFRSLCVDAGVPVIRLHSVRHTLASALHEAGEPPATVARLLGHTLAVHLGVYVTASDEGAQRAAERFGAVLAGSATG